MQLTKFNALLDIELRVSDPISATGAGYLAYFIWFDTFRMSTFYAVALVILLLVTFTASIVLRVL